MSTITKIACDVCGKEVASKQEVKAQIIVGEKTWSEVCEGCVETVKAEIEGLKK